MIHLSQCTDTGAITVTVGHAGEPTYLTGPTRTGVLGTYDTARFESITLTPDQAARVVRQLTDLLKP